MTFLSHPACSSGFIQDFLDQYAALQMQKAPGPMFVQWCTCRVILHSLLE